MVDASDLGGLKGNIPPERVIEIIDHRKFNEADKFPKAKVQIEYVGAAATLIIEKFINANIEISKSSAILLYGAIVSNTLNFKGNVTAKRDIKAAKYLNQIAQLPKDFIKTLFLAKSDLSGEKLKQRIKGETAHFIVNENRISIIQLEIIGVNKLLSERGNEIIKILEHIQTGLNLKYIFSNNIDLEEEKTYFFTSDPLTKQILTKIFNVQFQGNTAVYPKLILRKEIMAILSDKLDKP
ncbi:MAG: hypothetical protein Q7S37_01945 [bacterium]|nr:hypothetical protein [bacterium]